MLERWLEDFPRDKKILDLGCGSGSLAAQLASHRVFGVDVDVSAPANLPRALADSHRLPFAAASFDLVICHHSLEHFHDIPGTVREIRRVLGPEGRLFVTVPDGRSFSDRLYRFLLCGGGHLQRFTFAGIVAEIESGTGLHLAGWKELSSSFIFIDKRNFVPAPGSGPLPRRMRWLGTLPSQFFSSARILLNLATPKRFNTYGWCFAFTPEKQFPVEEPGNLHICIDCGAGFDGPPGKLFCPCPYCKGRAARRRVK
jgi:SAM-dependent methyltransferase